MPKGGRDDHCGNGQARSGEERRKTRVCPGCTWHPISGEDVARSVAFYTTHLGFTLKHQQLPAFASVARATCRFCSVARKRPDPGRCQTGSSRNPVDGTASRFVSSDLPGFVEALKKSDLHFRNNLEVGPGGKQIQIEDPDGNPVELFEPAR